jgi:hypothetical protein
MNSSKIAFAAIVAIVVIAGVAIYFTQSSHPAPTTGGGQATTSTTTGEIPTTGTTTTEAPPEDFTTIEEQLSDLENFIQLNLDNDFGIGAIAGDWG